MYHFVLSKHVTRIPLQDIYIIDEFEFGFYSEYRVVVGFIAP